MLEFVGYTAAFCTTISFLPQAIKVYKTQKTNDISLGMFLLMTFGVALWLLYGIAINAAPLWAANAVTFVLAAYILFMKIKIDGFRRSKKYIV